MTKTEIEDKIKSLKIDKRPYENVINSNAPFMYRNEYEVIVRLINDHINTLENFQ